MKIAKNAVVTLRYHVSDIDGNLLDAGENPLTYLHGGYEQIFSGVESALEGRSAGEDLQVRLEPEDAFGEYDADLVRVEPRDLFPKDLQVGMQFEGVGSGDEDDDVTLFTITDIEEGKVVVDGNHPWAGKALDFFCSVMEVRPATHEEITHGHVHGEHGHVH
jgi:FKBP-type peptidyl-prolyl cis-trans isomerase SlyD